MAYAEDSEYYHTFGYNPAFFARVRASRKAERKASRIERAKNRAKDEAEKRGKALEAAIRDFLQREQKALKEPESESGANIPITATITYMVCQAHDMDKATLFGANRNVKIVAARDDWTALVKVAKPDASLPQIGIWRNRADHTTILHSIRKRGWTGTKWANGDPVMSDIAQSAGLLEKVKSICGFVDGRGK